MLYLFWVSSGDDNSAAAKRPCQYARTALSLFLLLLLFLFSEISSTEASRRDDGRNVPVYSWLYSINELRTMLVESGRDDPVLSGINHENDKVLISERISGGGGGGGGGSAYLLGNRSSLYDPMPPTISTSSGVVRMQNRKVSEHIGPDGRLKSSICDQPNGFLRKQRALCLQYIQLMESVVRGYFMGLRECEYQFAAHRWNCLGYNLTIRSSPSRRKPGKVLRSSQIEGRSKRKHVRTYMDRLLSSGTRESAYVLAVTSAGISHAVTKACSSGMHDSCGCDRTIYDHERQPNFEWSGCSDNIHFGAAFSRKFLDSRERGRVQRNPKLGLTNLHNNHVGRQAVVKKMDIKCKCHGVSGSCEMRTCWRALPDFRSVGTQLRELFQEAVMVDYVNNRLVPKSALYHRPSPSGPPQPSPSAQSSVPVGASLAGLPMLKENELIYTTRSPSYCHHDPRFGSIGTYGRRCSVDSKGPDNCNFLCCGRDYRREVFIQQEKCKCKFHWCCEVRCETCEKTVVVSTCN
ncbi:Protein Wnt-4 [Echinococcus granulosus]|uniref:Protein Wnt n=1 Tax=Echinococcus granulosus TaxID=6210 RepID=A0A068WQJ8_ECHGR|nr:Protein Wnt-4 [Echinococcus granulosus]CDS19930.1 Protein Wnt-5 [Echinococcus granulosus]